MPFISQESKLRIKRLDQETLAENGLEILFSASFIETYTHQGKVTRHPTEDARTLTDHKLQDPQVISVEAAFSGNPLNVSQLFQGLADTAAGEHAELLALYRLDEIFKLETGTDVIDYCLLESIGRPRDKNSGGVYFVNLVFVEAQFASSQEAIFEQEFNPGESADGDGQATTDQGAQSVTEPPRRQSLGAKITKGLANYKGG